MIIIIHIVTVNLGSRKECTFLVPYLFLIFFMGEGAVRHKKMKMFQIEFRVISNNLQKVVSFRKCC